MFYRILQTQFSTFRKYCGKQLCLTENILSSCLAALSVLPNADSSFALDGTLVGALAGIGITAGISCGLLYRRIHSREEQHRVQSQNSEAQLRALLTMTDDAVLVLDSLGIIRSVNVAAEELFSITGKEFEGLELTQFIPQPLCLGELTRRGPVSFESIAMRPGGQHVKVEVFLSQVELTNSTSYLVLIHEKDMQAASVPAPKSDITAPVSKYCHELNNQLTGIIGNLSLILMAGEQDAATHQRAKSAKKNALRAQEITSKLQSLTKNDDTPEGDIDTTPAPGTIVQMPNLVAPATPAKKQPRVLVLDDEEAICGLVCTALSSMGYDVTEATSVPAALLACEQAMKTGRRYQVVISDLSLPGDLSGDEAVARLRKIDPEIKAIISSGYDSDPIMSHYRDHGFNGAISKPYELTELNRVVREVVTGGSKQESSRSTSTESRKSKV